MSSGLGDCALGAGVVALDDDGDEDDGERVGAEPWSSPLQAAVKTRIKAHRAAAGRVMIRALPGRAPTATWRDNEGGKSLSRADSAGVDGYLDSGL